MVSSIRIAAFRYSLGNEVVDQVELGATLITTVIKVFALLGIVLRELLTQQPARKKEIKKERKKESIEAFYLGITYSTFGATHVLLKTSRNSPL